MTGLGFRNKQFASIASVLVFLSGMSIAAPLWAQLQASPSGADQVLTSVYDAKTNALRTEGGSGNGGIGSVGLSMPGEFTVSGSPLTSSGTISVGWSQPVSIGHGGTGQSTAAGAFSALAPPTAAGGLIFGTGVNTYGNLSIGPAGECLQSSGTGLVWAACAGGSSFFPGGDLSGTANAQTVIGLEGRPVSATAPSTGAALEWNGTAWAPASLSGFGSVTSVGLALPSLFNVAGSPITGSGVITATLANQAANMFLAGPASGAAAPPAFRALTLADLPSIPFSSITGIAAFSQLPSSLAQFAGSITAGDCAKWSSSGVLTDAGSTCGSGGALAIETNGSNNANQAALNLVAGSGIALTNTSGGNVSIAATGGGALPAYWLNNSSAGSLVMLPNAGQDATPLIVGPSPTSVQPTSDLFDVYAGYLSTPSGLSAPAVAAGGSIPTGDVVTECVTIRSVAGETPCSATETSAASTTGNQTISVFSPGYQSGATGWSTYAAACPSPGPCASLTLQYTNSTFWGAAGVTNLAGISTNGPAPPAINTALANKAFGVTANGNLNLGSTYNLSLGANGQPDASFVRLYGGEPGSAYLQFLSPELAPPQLPQAVMLPTGGSIGQQSSYYPIEITYTNGQPAGQNQYNETPSSPTAYVYTSGCGAGTCEISIQPPPQDYAQGWNLYMKNPYQNPNQWVQINTTPITTFSSPYILTSPPNGYNGVPPTSNSTGSQYMTTVSAAPGVSGLACVNSGVPGPDCAPGTFVATNPMTTSGDLITGGAVNAEGVAAPTVIHTGATGYVLTSNGPGAAPTWQPGGGPAGSSSWSSLAAPTSNLTLSDGSFNTTFNSTNAAAWTWANTSAATASASQNSPALTLTGSYWTGSASATDSWTIQNAPGTGTNGSGALQLFHSGSPGISYVELFGSGAGEIYFANCGTSTCNALGINDNGGSARFAVSGSGYAQAWSYTFDNASGKIVTGVSGNTDLTGTIAVNAASSATVTFPTPYGVPPVCTITPTANPGSMSWWVTTSATGVTANLSSAGTLIFNYICVGAQS